MSSPKRGVAYDFPIALVDSSDTGSFKASPTLATGDFKISKDDGAYTNLATLPTNVPASSINVKIVLSTAEMTADKIAIQCIDAAGAEWDDVLIFIDATIANIDDVVRSTTPVNTLDVDASGDVTAENMRGTDGANTTTPPTTTQINTAVVAGQVGIDAAAIKVVTDLFQFTATNQIQSDVQYVNAVQLTGTGVSGDEWGP